MKNIEELIKNVKKYKEAIVHEKFVSNKNTVAYVTIDDKPRLLKWFVPGLKRQMITEYDVLKKGSAKLNIPSVYKMILSYVRFIPEAIIVMVAHIALVLSMSQNARTPFIIKCH